jgi:hypothetical protein
MQIYNALQLKKGAKVDYNRMSSITQPIQFLSSKDKDDEWCAWNMDWLEWMGIRQVRKNATRLMKNYKLAKGQIDKSDYIVENDNEYLDLVETLSSGNESSALELKFYPIIPNIINVLTSEFAKRNTMIQFTAVDDYSYNELMEKKRADIENYLVQIAEEKMMIGMLEQGLDPEDPQVQEYMQKQMSRENLKTLPEIQDFYTKSYKSIAEQWATKQMKIDDQRFSMEELEERAFRDMLITDREFWHFRMGEDDYEIELWNPVLTFYHKSPEVRYISQSNYVGKLDIMTIPDVLDKYGWLMTQEQQESLESLYPVRSAGYNIGGLQNDGSFYDPTKSHEWNTNRPSLEYRQLTSMLENSFNDNDVVGLITGQSEDGGDLNMATMLRVTTCYWKSQRKVGHLTKITEAGEVINEVISENYKITDKPVYNTTLFKNKTKDNLIFGEHIDWIWINQSYGGVKIGPNRPTYWGMNNTGGINPIYIGINQNQLGPLKYQFKGDNTLYGCLLPVEGSVFSDRNTKSTSLVDLTKPFQIGYNIVNNQIADILVDELGTVVLLDQNSLPKHSLGEDWGKGNYANAYVAMKNFQILPLDTSITNTENALNFQHFQTLNLEQTNRLMSRIQLANYFKLQCMETVGVTPQRMGQQIGQTDTARGIEQSVAGSYAQTENYFIQHSDYLMPRVHRMRTDLAQYYASTKPSLRMQYSTSNDERVMMELNGNDLLLRDINVFATTKANHRAILEKLKLIAESNNTTGATIYDLGNIVQSQSLGELNTVLKKLDDKLQQTKQQEMQQQQQMLDQELQSRTQEAQLERDHTSLEKEKDRRKDILIAEIRAAGMGSMVDLDKNQQSDFQDYMTDMRKSQEFADTMSFNREKETTKSQLSRDKLSIEREKINAQKDIANKQLEIARTNKNKYDVKQKDKPKK